MITVITGTPGSGKTLFAIQKLLLPLVGTTIEVPDEEGGTVEMPRTIYTNINGLQLDHERIDDSEEFGLKGWHNWALPGSVIVFDEFQKAWPPRPNGSKVPPDVQALDTHRHMGVDFILITQNAANVDRHIHGLVGRHLHIRRLANAPMATVYEWDHLSKTLMFSKAMKMTPFFFSRKVYRLYKSAKVHTKQPRSMPGVVWFLAAAVASLFILGPTAYARLSERIGGKPDRTEQAAAKPAIVQPSASTSITAREISPGVVEISGIAPEPSAAAAAPSGTFTPALPAFSGCVAFQDRCQCFSATGAKVDADADMCDGLQSTRPAAPTVGRLRSEFTGFTPSPTPSGLHF